MKKCLGLVGGGITALTSSGNGGAAGISCLFSNGWLEAFKRGFKWRFCFEVTSSLAVDEEHGWLLADVKGAGTTWFHKGGRSVSSFSSEGSFCKSERRAAQVINSFGRSLINTWR